MPPKTTEEWVEEYRRMFNQSFVDGKSYEAVEIYISTLRTTLHQKLQKAVEENKKLRLHLGVVLPMAKGYVFNNNVGRNREMVSNAEDYLSELDHLTSVTGE